MRRSTLVLFLTLATGLILCGFPIATIDAQVSSLTHNGAKRRYLVYTPASYANDSSRAFPVVLNFHGGGMTMAEQMLYTRMNRTADSAGFIVVYPQGIQQDWNVGFETSYEDGTDDVGFTEALLNKLQRDYRTDPRRVYATGLSRGGFFCQRLAAELSHRIAAIAAVGAPMPQPVLALQRARGTPYPVGVMLVHGTSDQIVRYDGKPDGYLSAQETYAYWKQRSRLTASDSTAAPVDRDPSDGTSITILESRGARVMVMLLTVLDGGHTWPGADPFNVGLPIGRTSRDVDLNAWIWRFFAGHSR